MKLTTENLRGVIAQRVAQVSQLSFDSDELPMAMSPKLWKRHSKMSLAQAVECFAAESIEDFLEMGDCTDTMDPQPMTPKCVVRHFVVADLTLDCTVVSDEDDQKVLAMLWHRD